jgi:hypothetical protein
MLTILFEHTQMSESRIKIKFGGHEFEAEGSPESVERLFESFKHLIAPPPPETSTPSETAPPPPAETKASTIPLHTIVRIQGRVVSLSVNAKSEDAVLLLLLGQMQFRRNNTVSGAEVMEGLRESGLKVRRADRILATHIRDGYVVAMGQLRRRRYRLSNAGIDRAQQLIEVAARA